MRGWRIVTIAIMIMQFASSFSQCISGKVTDMENVPLPFANVALLNESDSVVVCGAVSADDGTFAIATNRQGGVLRVSCFGFQTLYTSSHQGFVGILQMKPSATNLNEVTLTGSNIIRMGDKEVIWITSSMRRGKYNTGEMLGAVPGVLYNRMTKSLSYYGEENIMLLVDSVEKNIDYIKRLHHVRFDYVDIIPYPKGKYEGYAVVINLHTRPDYEGYEGSIGIGSEYFPTNRDVGGKMFSAISNESSITYTRNKWNFFINCNGDFNRIVQENFSEVEYPMNYYKEVVIANANHCYNRKEYSRSLVLTGGADYQFNKRHSLSLAYRFGLQNNDSYGRNTVVQIRHSLSDTIQTNQHGDDDGYAHTIAAYYRGGFGAWNYSTDVNFVQTNADACNLLRKSSGYINQDDRHNLMNHTLARVEFNRKFFGDKLYFAVGYNNFWKKYAQTRLQTSAILTDYSLRQNKFWFYSSFNMSNKTSINVATSLILNNTRSMGQKDFYLSYDASCGLFQKISNNSWARFNYQCEVRNPTINQVTSYGQFVDSLQWEGGNPLLRSAITHNFDFRFQFCKWVSLMMKYKYQPRSFCRITELCEGVLENGENSYYASTTTQNAKYQNLWIGLYYWQRIKNLSLSADWYFRYASGKYQKYQNSINYWHGNFTVDYFCKALNMNASAAYNLSIDYDAWAQGTSKNQVDMFWVYLSRAFFKDCLELSFSYVLPIHLTSGGNCRYIDTPALKAWHNDYNLNRLSNHNFEISITYRFLGGKTIRKYNREMSDEK